MSLQVWLPLTKDLRQQGLSNITVTNNGATFNSAGKLGGCYLFDGSNDYMVGTYNATAEISFAAWINMPVLPGGKHIFDARTSEGTGYQPMYLTNTSIQVGCSGSGSGYPSFNYTWVANTWYHICVTHNTTEVKCYVNGVLIGSSTTGKGVSLGTCNFTLGSRCNQANYSNVKINDVRIYNHCLSEQEVKKLAQGLIVHYPLNRQGWGQENLLSITPMSYVSANYLAYQFTLSENLVANQTYTIQFWDVDVAHSAKSATNLGIDVYWGGGSLRMIYWHGTSYFNNGHADYLVGTFTVTSTQASGSGSANLWLNIYNSVSNADGTRSMSIGKWKLEKGSIATPWCPNSSDEMATTLGLNNEIEYDISGFGNNATSFINQSYTSDTPKYVVSTVFQNGTTATISPIFSSTTRHKQLTFATWVKRSSDDANYHYYWNNGGVRLGIRAYNSVNNYYLIAWTHATDSAYEDHGWVSTVMPKDTWIHVAWVFDSGVWKQYVNGVLNGTRNDSSYGTYVYGDVGSILGNSWIGNLSDFRVYATALSADDIKSLYQNCATIGPDGTIYGQIRN